jgi:hypothetical protein
MWPTGDDPFLEPLRQPDREHDEHEAGRKHEEQVEVASWKDRVQRHLDEDRQQHDHQARHDGDQDDLGQRGLEAMGELQDLAKRIFLGADDGLERLAGHQLEHVAAEMLGQLLRFVAADSGSGIVDREDAPPNRFQHDEVVLAPV